MIRRKRIAIVLSGGVAPIDRGIHIPAIRKIVEQLAEQFDIEVFTFGSPTTRDEQEYSCGKASITFVTVSDKAHWLRKLFVLLRALRRSHLDQPFELIHGMLGLIPELASVLFGRVARVPVLISFLGGETADIPEIRYGNLSRVITRLATKWVYHKADLLHLLSSFQERQAELLGKRQRRTFLFPIGADANLFHLQKRSIVKAPLRCIHVASLTPVKDQETLLRAFASISETIPALLRIIGEDYLHGKIQKMAIELGIDDRIEFLGYLQHTELPQHLHWADLMLHTSLHEAQGVVIAEAAACGVAIAGTNVGLIADLAGKGAVAVEPRDADGLAEEVLRLLSEPDRLESLRHHAYGWAISHDLASTIEQLANLYQKYRR